jgi:hypothetical protein
MDRIERRRLWRRTENTLKALGGVITAAAVALVGIIGAHFYDRQQARETSTRLFADLMSKREEADSSLRTEMFKSVINTFVQPKSAGLEEKVLNLELLAYNFHESLDLGPLFKHVQNEIIREHKESEYLERLEKVTQQVTNKQVSTLEEGGGKLDGRVPDSEKLGPLGWTAIDGDLVSRPTSDHDAKSPARKRHFTLSVLFADTKKKELKVKLHVRTFPRPDTDDQVSDQYSIFWVGFFDFPMIDNLRLSDGQRCAVVLSKWEAPSVELVLVYFPGSRASLKEKPYYDELLRDLLQSQKSFEDR